MFHTIVSIKNDGHYFCRAGGNRPDGLNEPVTLNEEGKTEVEMNQTGGIFWPSSKHIDPARLTPQILLVKDHGVYLITNASLDGTPVSRDTVVYARGMNPSVDDEWYDEAEEALGGDDSSVSIPVAWFELALKKKFNAFSIKVSPTKITLVNG
ncbi:DUF3085 domain-containing protein [Escherichia coli]|uniref:DUF3085 domain-containing protein n=1 Tax=Escherichia coli TaxID=562 RepID=UPI002F9657F2